MVMIADEMRLERAYVSQGTNPIPLVYECGRLRVVSCKEFAVNGWQFKIECIVLQETWIQRDWGHAVDHHQTSHYAKFEHDVQTSGRYRVLWIADSDSSIVVGFRNEEPGVRVIAKVPGPQTIYNLTFDPLARRKDAVGRIESDIFCIRTFCGAKNERTYI